MSLNNNPQIKLEEKKEDQEPNKYTRLNIDSLFSKRPYLSNEAREIVVVLAKNYELNGSKCIIGTNYMDFETSFRKLWQFFIPHEKFMSSENLVSLFQELRTSGIITIWTQGCYKVEVRKDTFNALIME